MVIAGTGIRTLARRGAPGFRETQFRGGWSFPFQGPARASVVLELALPAAAG